MKKSRSLIAVMLMMVGMTLAISAPAANAVPVMYPQMVWYDDHQGQPISQTHRASDEINRTGVTRCDSLGTQHYLNLADVARISALLLWVPTGKTTCNWLYVQSVTGKVWGKCVNKDDWGFDFGADFNDKSALIGVRYKSTCPRWQDGWGGATP